MQARAQALIVALACAAAAPAQAQDFPPRQMVIVVGFPAGGGTDLFARVFAQKLAAALGTTVIVDNRPGAAGTVGNALVARAGAQRGDAAVHAVEPCHGAGDL